MPAFFCLHTKFLLLPRVKMPLFPIYPPVRGQETLNSETALRETWATFKLSPNKPRGCKVKASHVDGQLKHVGSQIFTVKLALVLTEHLDYRRGGQIESCSFATIVFMIAPVHHCKIRCDYFPPPFSLRRFQSPSKKKKKASNDRTGSSSGSKPRECFQAEIGLVIVFFRGGLPHWKVLFSAPACLAALPVPQLSHSRCY